MTQDTPHERVRFVMETPEDEVCDDNGNMEALQGILKSCGLKAN